MSKEIPSEVAPRCSVYAVMSVTVHVFVRGSSGEETLNDLHRIAKREAEETLREALPNGIKPVGEVQFSHCIVKRDNP